MVVVALVGVVLLQRSEGGALGIGGGGGFMTSRGTANVLTRTTAILATVFFLTSLALSVLPRFMGDAGSVFDTVPGATAPATDPGAVGGGSGGVLDDLNQLRRTPAPGAQIPEAPAGAPQVPAVPAPAAPSGGATLDQAPVTPDVPAADAPFTVDPAPAAPAPGAPTPPAATAPEAPAPAVPPAVTAPESPAPTAPTPGQ